MPAAAPAASAAVVLSPISTFIPSMITAADAAAILVSAVKAWAFILRPVGTATAAAAANRTEADELCI